MSEETYFSELLSHPCYPNNLTKFIRSSENDICAPNTNLCDLKFKISPEGLTQQEIHGSLNWFACIDLNQCPSIKVLREEVIAKFCSIPSCTVFEANTSQRQLCILSQTLGCSLQNRFELSSSFEVSALCAVDSEDQSNVISAPDSSLLQELNEHKLVISSEQMSSLVDCGVGYAYDLPSLIYSGFATSLGSFKPCINHHAALIKKTDDGKDEISLKNEAAYKYCVTNFDTMVHTGTCLPHTCDGPKYQNMLAFLCDSLDSVQTDDYFRGSETCLDYIDMLPINTCLMVQMMGCNSTLATSTQGNFDVMSLFVSSHTNPDPKTRMLYDWAELNPTFNSQSWNALVEEFDRVRDYMQNQIERNAPHRSLLSQNLAAAAQSPKIDWFGASTEDTIKNYRYESDQFHKMSVRCGGWFDKLDDSQFNRIAGWLTAIAILLLPFYPPRFKRGVSIADSFGKLVASWPNNIKRNLAMNIGRAYKLGSGEFAHICGLRSLNMAWVVLGHTFTFSWQEGVDRNFARTLQLIHDYKFQIILSGQLAVDSFFFIAGLMFGLFSAARIESLCNQIVNLNFASASIKAIGFSLRQCTRRYLRLMTTTAFVLAISYWIIPYLWTGPMWVSYVDYVRYGQVPSRDAGCYTHWWKVLFMISNLDAGGLACMGHTWYLANDFQFYIVANIMVMMSTMIALKMRGANSSAPTSRKPLYITIFALFVLTSAYSYKVVVDEGLHFAIPAFSDASLTPGANQGSRDLLTNWTEFYVKPWCRIGPYLIGMVAGILYRDRQFEKFITTEQEQCISATQVLIDDASPLIRKAIDENSSPVVRRREAPETPRPSHPYQDLNDEPSDKKKPNTQVIYAYTFVSFILAYVCVVSFPYEANKGNILTWNVTVDRLWFVFNRSVWALCCAWLALILAYVPVYKKQMTLLRPLKEFLGCKPMALCSIFTFTFYLVHPFVQQIYYASRTTDVGLSNLIGWFATLAHFVVTIFFGVLLCIMVEIPLEYLCRSIGF